jgi:hypothetical protein
MPVLDINEDVLSLASGASGTLSLRLLAYLESLMLWPHAPKKRQVALRARQAEYALELSQDLLANGKMVPAEIVAVLVADAYDAPRPLSDSASDRALQDGVAAGSLLRVVVRMNLVGKVWSVTKVAEHVAKTKGLPRYVTADNLVNHVWPQYRPVSHLWAAVGEAFTPDSHTPFPCSPVDLAPFLGTAEFFREKGEKIRLKQARKPILEAREMWTLAPGLSVPKMALKQAVPGD